MDNGSFLHAFKSAVSEEDFRFSTQWRLQIFFSPAVNFHIFRLTHSNLHVFLTCFSGLAALQHDFFRLVKQWSEGGRRGGKRHVKQKLEVDYHISLHVQAGRGLEKRVLGRSTTRSQLKFLKTGSASSVVIVC